MGLSSKFAKERSNNQRKLIHMGAEEHHDGYLYDRANYNPLLSCCQTHLGGEDPLLLVTHLRPQVLDTPGLTPMLLLLTGRILLSGDILHSWAVQFMSMYFPPSA